MDRTERFYKIQQLLAGRRAVPRDEFLSKLGISRATFKRDLDYLRERLMVPIIWDREAGGYRIDQSDSAHGNYQLPGFWFSSDEVHALLAMEQLLRQVEPRLLGPHAGPLRSRIRKLIEAGDHSFEEFERRIRVLAVGAQAIDLQLFQRLVTALLHRRRLEIEHHDRRTDTAVECDISPQRLVHYRENWYLDAWSHSHRALRTFPVDAIGNAQLVNKRAREITDKTLDAELGAACRIFAGRGTETAVLRFSPQRAHWIAHERWHPEQAGSYELGGGFVLQVPYSDPRELVMDILKYADDVVVLGPPKLRAEIGKQLKAAAANYADGRRRRRKSRGS